MPPRHRIYIGDVAGSTPRKEAFFNSASPATKVARASPRRAGVASQGVFKSPSRQAAASARRQERYGQLELASAAATAAQAAADAAADEAAAAQDEAMAYQASAMSAAGQRPTTSRHIPNPSPERFHDYIVPSPTKAVEQEVWDFAASASDHSDSDEVDTDYDVAPDLTVRGTRAVFSPPSMHPPPRASFAEESPFSEEALPEGVAYYPPPKSRLSAAAPDFTPAHSSPTKTFAPPADHCQSLGDLGRYLLGIALTN